jgi:hypothetical protein
MDVQATPAPAHDCYLERRESGSVEFVCAGAADGSRRVLIDGTDCGRIQWRGDAIYWTGCARITEALHGD